MLELGRIRARFPDKPDEHFRPFQVAVMVGSNVGNEIGRVTGSDQVIVDFYFHKYLLTS
jgi:hypothetical protein